MDKTGIKNHIEALLFYSGEEMKFSELSEILDVSVAEIKEAVTLLEEDGKNRGLTAVSDETSVYLGTAPASGEYIEQLRKKKLSGDLGKALLETLTVILYQSPVPKSHIDYIRGVNTSTALRYLMARGLIEKDTKEGGVVYTPSKEVLRHLGVQSVEELPDYEKAASELEESLENFDAFEEEEEEE